MIIQNVSKYGASYSGKVDDNFPTVVDCTTDIVATSAARRAGQATVNCETDIEAAGFIGLAGAATTDCETVIVSLPNRFRGASIVDCETELVTFVGTNRDIKIYQSGSYQGSTRGLNFVGGTVTLGDDKFTVTFTGGGSVELDYDIEIDEIDATTKYIGYALPGTATNATGWKIKKVVLDGDGSISWANGTADLDKIWDNRLSYSY